MPALNEQEVLDKIVAILVEITGYKGRIVPTTSLGKDIGLGGDDVTDFVRRVEQSLNVDISEFDSTEFFPDEGALSGLAALKHWLGFSSGYDVSRYKTLYVSDVVRAVVHKSRT